MPVPDIQEAVDLLNREAFAEAIPLLERLTDMLPAYVAAHVLLARAYEGIGRWPDALSAWQQAYFLMPNSPTVDRGLQRVLGAMAPSSTRPRRGPAPRTGGEAARGKETAPLKRFERKEDKPSRPSEERAPEVAVSPPPATGEVEGAPPSALFPSEAARWANAAGFDDLERLIEELESARIVPRVDLDAIPPPDLDDDIDDMVSETLARIYAAQKQYDEAARIYELLAAQQPEQAGTYLQKASEMRARAAED